MTAPQTDRPLILPPLRRTAKDAEAFARVVHEGQFDKAGKPYIEHVAEVARDVRSEMVKFGGYDRWDRVVEDAIQIAWLHDVIEDTPYTADDLTAEGFSNDVVMGVDALSKPGGRLHYLDWINHLATTAPLAVILVKIADVEDNSDPKRLALLDESTRERLSAKYGAALPVLKDAAARLGWRKG